MKSKIILPAIFCLLVLSCTTPEFYQVKVDNPEFFPDSAFVGYEDLSNPKFAALKEKYQLDTIFHGETDELKRILLIRNWINKHIKIDNDGPYTGDGSVESILDEALKGHGFNCGHYTAVQNAMLNGYGYVARCIIADTGVPVDFIAGGGHHAINEVWLNSLHKWFVSDAKYNFQFEKNGIPLSALEIRDEFLKNKATDITSKIPNEDYPELKKITMAQFASIYTWLSWGKHDNRYSNFPKTNTDYMNVYADDYVKSHTWLWDGKPHWAYNTEFMNLITNRRAIEWTPNTISSKVVINGHKAGIELHSITPNLKTYQIKELPGQQWKDVTAIVEIDLKKDKNEFIIRSMNLAGVAGAEHKIIIQKK